MAVPRPWANMPVVPALVRWRLVGRYGPITEWRTAFDVRETLPGSAYDSIFAQWTRQNHPNQPGRYRVYLAHDWSSTTVPDGRYGIEVEATDTRGNTGRWTAEIRIAN